MLLNGGIRIAFAILVEFFPCFKRLALRFRQRLCGDFAVFGINGIAVVVTEQVVEGVCSNRFTAFWPQRANIVKSVHQTRILERDLMNQVVGFWVLR